MNLRQNSRVFINPLIGVLALVLTASALAFGILAFVAKPAHAAIPSTIGYQGRLKNSSGTAQTGTFSFTFRLYNASSGGTSMWSEIQSIAVSDGFVVAQLGAVTPFPDTIDFNQSMYFTVEVGADGEMSPRVPVNSVPYAYTAGGISALSDVSAATATGGRMFYDTTNGALNYYDGITATWRNLRQGTVTSTLQQITDAGSVTTNAIQFAGGTSTSDFAFSGAVAVTGSLTVGGVSVCLQNATNCPAYLLAETDTLATVTARGSSATTTLQLYGGFVGASSTVTSTFTVLGDTSLQTLTATNATFTNATSVWIGATSVSTSNLFVNGSEACLQNGVNCPATVYTDTLATVTARGSFATSTLLLYGGFVGASSTVTSTFTVLGMANLADVNVTGASALQVVTFTDATGSNVTTTNLAILGSASATRLYVSGELVCLASGTNCPSGTTPNFQTVTNTGNTTTNAIIFGGGTSTEAFVVSSTFMVLGSSALQTLTATNATFTSVTTTAWLGFSSASGSTLNASAIFVNGSAVCLSSGTNCVVQSAADTSTLAQITARGSSATTTVQLYGGFIGASSTVTSTFTVLGDTNLQNITATNATATNVTTTNLFISGVASTTQLNANSGSFGTLTVGGASVCLTNGTDCPAYLLTESDTLATVTARGSFATTTLQLYGGFLAASSTVTSTFTVLGQLGVSSTASVAGDALSVSGTSKLVGNASVSGTITTSRLLTGSDTVALPGLSWALQPNTGFYRPQTSEIGVSIAGVKVAGILASQFNIGSTVLQPLVDAGSSFGGAAKRWSNGWFSGTVTSTNLETVNVTTTNLYASGIASTTQLNANNGTFGTLTVGGQTVCLTTGTNCPAYLLSETDTLATVTARGSFATTTLLLYGGFIGASSTVTGTLTVADVLQVTGEGTSTFVGAVSSSKLILESGSLTNLALRASVQETTGMYFGSNIMSMVVGGARKFYFTNSSNVSDQAITPGLPSAYNLGGSTLRWANIYGVNGDFSGSVTTSNLYASGFVSTTQLFVNGSTVCLTSGVDCPAYLLAESDTLATVTARGSFATTTLLLYGGFIGASSTVTSTFTVLGDTNLQNITATNVTTTNLSVSGIASTTQLIVGYGATGTPAIRFSGNENTGFVRSATDTIGIVTSGTIATLFGEGGVSTTNLYASGVVSTTQVNANAGEFGALTVGGVSVCLANATNCPAYLLSESDTLATVTARDSSATTTLQLFGGFVGASSTVTSTFTVLGDTNLQNITAANATATNVTTTNVFASGVVSTTQINANNGSFGTLTGGTGSFSSLTVGGQNVCLTTGTNCPAYLLAESDTLATVTARGSFATTTLQLYGGFIGASSTVTGTLTVADVLRVTGTNTSTFTGDISASHIAVGDGSSVFPGITFQSGTNYGMYKTGGSVVMLTGGTGVMSWSSSQVAVSAALVPNGDDLRDFGSNIARWRNGFFSGTVSSTNFLGTNATTTNATTTNLYASGVVSTTQLNANAGEFGALTVGGVSVCLEDATNCPAYLLTETDTLATVTARGSFATTTLQLYGGFVGASSTVTSTFTVLGDTSLQNIIATNATFTNATATNLLVSGQTSTTQLNANSGTFGTLTVGGQAVCLSTGTDCPAYLLAETDTLASVTARGSSATTTLQLYGGFIGASSTVTSTLKTSAFAVYGTATSTFAGPISTAGTNLIVASNSSNNLLLNPYGGNVGVGTSTVTAKLQVFGGAVILQGGTTVNALTSLSAASLNNPELSVVSRYADGQRSGVHIYAGNNTSGMFLTSPNAGYGLMSVGISYNGSAIYTATETTGSSFEQNLGNFIFKTATGTVGSSATLTERMRLSSTGNLGIGTASPSTKLDVQGVVSSTGMQFINATGTNATTTNLFASNAGLLNASTTNLTVRGQTVCLTNGTDCPAYLLAESDTLATVTARGSFATSTLLLYGGFIGASSTVTGTLTVADVLQVTGATTSTFAGAVSSTRFMAGPGVSPSAPAFSFAAEPDLGFYRVQADTMGFAVNGGSPMRFGTTGLMMMNGFDILANVGNTNDIGTLASPFKDAFFGGVVSSTNLSFVNATGTNVTTTNLFVSGIASTTQLNANAGEFGALTVGGVSVCLEDATNCPAYLLAESDTLASVTDRGSYATTTLQLYGGFIGASSTVTSTFTVLGQMIVSSTASVAGDALTVSGTSRLAGNVSVSGTITGTRLFASATAADTAALPGLSWALQPNTGFYRPQTSEIGVTIAGSNVLSFFTSSIRFANGAIPQPVNDNVLDFGISTKRWRNGWFSGTVTSTNLETVNATTTNLYASGVVSTTQLLVNGQTVCLSTGTNCPTYLLAEADTLATVSARGSSATTTLQFYGGFLAASSTVTSTFEVLGQTTLFGPLSSERSFDAIDKSLLFDMPLTEGTGTPIDRGRYNLPIVITGSPTSTDGKYGGALALNGVNQYGTITDTAAVLSVVSSTVELMYKPGALKQSIFNAKLAGGDRFVIFWYDSTHISVQYMPGVGTNVRATGVVADSEWHHIVVTTDGNTKVVTLWIDGVSYAQGASTWTTPDNTWNFGKRSATYDDGTYGQIRVYGRILNIDEIRHRYTVSLGSNNVYVSAAGNVGIGTTSPSTKLDVQGGLSFFSATGTNVTTTNIYTSGVVSTTQLFVNGRNVCLSTGTNCPAYLLAESDTLANVTARGSFATTTLQLYGGFVGSSSTVTSTLSVGDSLNVYGTNTSIFAGDVSSTRFLAGIGSAAAPSLSFAGTQTGFYRAGLGTLYFSIQGVKRATLTSAGLSLGSGTALATDADNTADIGSAAFRFNDGFFGGVVSSTNLSFVSATGTNVTTTNLYVSGIASTTQLNANAGEFGALTVGGVSVCLEDATNCPAYLMTESDTLATVTARGSFATSTLQLYGGFIAASSTVTSSIQVTGTGTSTFTGTISANRVVIGNGAVATPSLTFASEQKTGIYWPGSGHLTFSVVGVAAVDLLSNQMNIAVPILPTTDNVRDLGSAALRMNDGFFGGTVSSSIFVAGDGTAGAPSVAVGQENQGLYSAGVNQLQIVSGGGGSLSLTSSAFIFGNGVAPQPTTDNLYPLGLSTKRFSVGHFGAVSTTNLTVIDVTSTNVTTTNLYASGVVSTTQLNANAGEFGALTVGGVTVCLTDGTSCPVLSSAEVDTLATVAARGSSATTTLQLYGGFLTASSTVTSTLSVAGKASFASRVDAKYLNRWFLSPLLNNTIYGAARATTTVGSTPFGVAFDGSHVWVTNGGSASVSKVDINTNAVVATTTVGTNPYGVAFDGSHIWVTNYSSANVSKIDINTNAVVATIAVGTSPFGVAFDGSHIWVVNAGTANISKIDINTNAVVATTTVGAVGTNPYGVAFDGSHIWVTNYSTTNVSKIDINTNAVVATTTVGTNPYGVAFDGSHIWVTNANSANVSKVDINTNMVVATTTVGSYPNAVAFDGSHIWITNRTSANVSKIDINTNAVVATIAVGASPGGVAFDGSHIWIANFGSNTVTKLPIGGGSGANENYHVNLIPDTNNTFDIGSNALRFKDGYFDGFVSSTRFLSGLGTVAAPAFSNSTMGTGMFFPAANVLGLTIQGVERARLVSGSLTLTSGVSLLAGVDNTADIGSLAARFNDGFFGGVVSSTNLSFVSATGTNVTTTNLFISGTASTSQLYVGGQLVCLATGTNCLAASMTDLNWTYDLGGDFVRNATATTDVIIGNTAANTAPFRFDTNTTSSRLIIGQSSAGQTRADVTIGAATSSGMNALFSLSGDDLFVAGNIGSASSVFTNGEFVAGAASTRYGDGYLRTSGNYLINGGDASVLDTVGGSVTTTGGTGNGAGTGGSVTLASGGSGDTGDAGDVFILGGDKAGVGAGGDINLRPGDSGTVNRGAVKIMPFAFTGGPSDLRFLEGSGSGANYVGFKAGASLAGDVVWQLPLADGNANEAITTSGGGVLSFTSVCLTDGTNCPGTETLASVTDRGSYATTTLQFYGGFLTASSTVTSTFTVLGDTSLQNFTATNATFTNAYVTGMVGIGTTLPTQALEIGTEDVGQNVQINATLGPELTPSFVPGHWVGTNGWSANGTQLVKVTNATAGTITPFTTSTAPVIGRTYKISITASATGTTALTYTFGGVAGSTIVLGTTTDYITANTVGKLIITGAISSVATIDAISMKALDLTTSTGALIQRGDIKLSGELTGAAGLGGISISPTGITYNRGAFVNAGAMSGVTSLTMAGALSGVTTLANSGLQTATIPTLFVPAAGHQMSTVVTTGITAALIPIQYSPSYRLYGYGWDIDNNVNNYIGFRNWMEPYVGNTVNGRLKWETTRNSTLEKDFYELMSLSNDGEFNVLGKTLGPEVLTDTAMTDATAWLDTGGVSVSTTGYALYNHNAAGGTLTQSSVSLTTPLLGDRWYRFAYKTATSTITVRAFIDTTTTAAERIYLPGITPAAGVGYQVINFKTNSNPTDFKINFTSAVGIITLREFSLREIKSGNIVANGLFTGGSSTGMKIDNLGHVGIGTVSPSVELDVQGTVSSTNLLATNVTTTNFFALNFTNALTGDRTITAVSSTALGGTLNGGARQVIVRGRTAYVLGDSSFGGSDALAIHDVTNPASPTSTGLAPAEDNSTQFDLAGDFAFIVSTDLIQVVDVKNPQHSEPKYYNHSGVKAVKAVGRYLYVQASSPDITVYEINGDGGLIKIGSSETASAATAMLDVQGSYAYIQQGIGGGLRVIDVHNPAAMTEISGTNWMSVYQGALSVQGNYAYVMGNLADAYSGAALDVYNISNPSNPYLISTTPIGVTTTNIFVSGRYAYTATSSGRLIVMDVADPLAPVKYVLTTPTATENFNSVYVDGRYAYLTDNDRLLYIFDLGGLETNALNAATAEVGSLDVRKNAQFSQTVDIVGGLSVGRNGISSAGGFVGLGSLSVGATNTTSTVLGNFIVGTSTMALAGMNSLFSLSGNDLFVMGDIGSASSVFASSIYVTSTYTSTLTATGRVDAPYLNRWYLSPLLNDTIYGGAHATTTVGTNPGGVAFDGSHIWVANGGTSNVSKIDVTTNAVVATVTVGSGPRGVAFDGSHIWVTNVNDGTVSKIDITTNAVVATVTVGAGVRALAFDGTYMWATNFTDGTVSKIDITTNTVVATKGVGTGPYGIAFDGSFIWVVNGSANNVSKIDIATDTVVATTTVQAAPRGIAFDGSHMWVTNQGSATISKIDVATDTVVATLTTGATPYSVAFDGTHIWVVVYGLHSVSKIDVKTNMIVATIPVGTNPYGVAFDGSHVWVSNYNASPGTISKLPIGGGSGAYTSIASLMVGTSASVTGTSNYQAVITYAGSASVGGLCINDSATAATCPTTVTNASIMADNAVTANAFDLAETYNVNGGAEPGDLVILDASTSTTMRLSDGTPYDPRLSGVVSTNPGFVLGWGDGTRIALTGRAPTKVSVVNGPITIGDALTSSPYPGYAMKATKPGMIVGHALDNADTTSTIEVFVDVGYYAGATLQTDGTLALLTDNLLIGTTGVASSTVTTVDSFGLTFRGSAWDTVSSTVVSRDFTLLNDMISATTSIFAIRSTSSTNLFTVGQDGTVQVTGDLSVVGRLYPSARGAAQSQYYVFVDNSSSTNQYISTNADGWQAQTSYDLAERYFSQNELEPGDLVMASEEGLYGVAKAIKTGSPVMGIVSSKPGFLLGRNATDTYPIALSGRVPTKVSTVNGSIRVGDLLVASDTPGVAVKATENGYVIGIALEAYDGSDIGRVETFVAPHWNGSFAATVTVSASPDGTTTTEKRGFADIAAGLKKVHVAFPSLGTYPNVQAVPYGDAGTWWIEGVTDTGFDIVMSGAFSRDTRFAWTAKPTETGDILYNSDGTFGPVEPTTGMGPGMTTAPAPVTDPVTDPAPITDPVPVADTTSTPATDPIPVAEPIPIVDPILIP